LRIKLLNAGIEKLVTYTQKSPHFLVLDANTFDDYWLSKETDNERKILKLEDLAALVSIRADCLTISFS
jgi:hypothetical protein